MQQVKNIPQCKNCAYARLKPDSVFVPPQMGPGERLIISDYPTLEDAAKGPLTDGSGRIFDNILRKAGIRRNDLTILNTIQCVAPLPITPKDPSGGRGASAAETAAAFEQCYNGHVKPMLDSRPWGVINTLGDQALRIVTGERGGADKWRGSPLPLKGERKPKVVPTLHPNMLMKQQEMQVAVISDLKKGVQVPPEFYNIHPTIQEVIDFRHEVFSLDIETNRFTQQIICVGLSHKPYHAICVPFKGPYIDEIRRIMLGAKEIITHNGCMFDIPRLCAALGIDWDNT